MAKNLSNFLWDFSCAVSLVGIWPRFIEPNWLDVKNVKLEFPFSAKLAVFSDLHFKNSVGNAFLKKIITKTKSFKPDAVLFLGDFLCEGEMHEENRLDAFLKAFDFCPSYAVLGNHDYEKFVSINERGEYDIIEKGSHFKKAVLRLMNDRPLKGIVTERAQKLPENQKLLSLLKASPFKVLHNETIQLSVKGNTLNLTGLGEYMAGRANPDQAFQQYDKRHPGIVLVHNPDMIPKLSGYPGEIFLSGHTHGGQINLPLVWRKLTIMENIRYKNGLVCEENRVSYVTRGVGSIKKFRFNSRPELLLIELGP